MSNYNWTKSLINQGDMD